MLDIKLIRDNPEEIKNRLSAKEANFNTDIDRIIELDTLRREVITKADNSRAEQKRVSKKIPEMKKAGEDTSEIMAEMKTLSDNIKELDEKLRQIEDEYNKLMLGLYNLPDKDLKPGGKENNEPLRYFGEPHAFDFVPKTTSIYVQILGSSTTRGAKLPVTDFGYTKA